ncbi:EF-Hand 1, calcium-binding site [Phytophthora cactorum]|nr:EF-Hand 1, calcium-binding site [Phytophthora cactorum]
MSKARNKIDQMSTADWQQYHQLLSNQQLMKYFADEVHRFSRCPMKPDDVLRRFSLNGDGHLDLREFQLAVTRLEIVASSSQQTDGSRLPAHLWQPPTPPRPLSTRSALLQGTRAITIQMVVAPTSGGRNAVAATSTSITQSSEKLRQIFFKMDVMSSGKVSPEELELALSHIGVFLTTREYEKLYMSLGEDVKEYTRDGATNGRWRGRGGNGKAFTIKYAKFLALFQEKDGIDHRTQTMPSNSKQVSPPVVGVGSARLWDLLVAAFDKLQSLFHQFQRIGQYYLPPETFRDCLLRCGITLSNADFAALRVRLLPFSPVISESEPYPAGKSTQERNAEASRTIVKICDERRRESELHFPTATTSPRAVNSGESEAYLEHQHRRQDPFFSTGKPPPALEARILSKLQQLKQLGQLSGSSPQSVFPGDRFGHISRGQFRQSLSHLNLLVRYADVEALFWTLDTQGRGYITAQDFYDHLNNFATREKTTESSKQLPVLSLDGSTQRARLPRSVQKIFEKMLVELPRVVAICERMDTNQTGSVSTTEMLQSIHELGIMASIADKQAAIEALSRDQSQQQADQIPYHSLEDRLGALCSDLLSPRKRKKHLSTTSVLLAPHEEQPTEVASSYNHDPRVNDSLWNCPRRRLVQDHRAARSSIRIADELNSPNGEFSPVQPPRSSTDLEDAKSRQERRHRIALVSVLQDLLERRSDLKTALDLHRRADARGHVTKKDLVEILLTSRLNLHFPAGASAAQELVDELYPSLRPESGLGFLDVLRRISDLLGEVTKELSSVLPTAMSSFTKLASAPNGESFAGSASTVRRKLLQESRLKSLLDSDYGLQSAAVLVRHAFKGLAPRDMVVPIDNGEFEATCRASDIKHVCYRLGLDLDLQEQQFVASSIDTEDSGFVSSPGLLDFFTKLKDWRKCCFKLLQQRKRNRIRHAALSDILRGRPVLREHQTSKLNRALMIEETSQQLALTKDAAKMNRVTSGIGGALEGAQMRIETLTREIKADEKGKKDYDEQLFRLNERRKDLESKLKECREWSALFESKIKPLAGKYTETTDGMQGQYNEAKLRHAQGIVVLMENFDYHPEFKRFSELSPRCPLSLSRPNSAPVR